MSSPLYLTFKKRINDAIDEIICKQVTPWFFLHGGGSVQVHQFNGQQISYKGITFEGSPQTVFWGRYIEPFLENLAESEIAEAVKLSQERRVDGTVVLREVQQFLIAGFQKVYSQMAEVDRRLRGKGFPDKVSIKSAERELVAMQQFIEGRIKSETVMIKNSQNTNPSGFGSDTVARSLRLPTMEDFERNIDRALNEKMDTALKLYNDIKSTFMNAGGLSASRYPITVEAQLFLVLRESITDSMHLMSQFTIKIPYESIVGVARNRLNNFAQRLINAIDEANRQMPTLKIEETKHKFFKTVEDAFKDFEIGLIQGQPFIDPTATQLAVTESLAKVENTSTIGSIGQNSISASEEWNKESADALHRLDKMETTLQEIARLLHENTAPRTRGGIGDNNPPEPIDEILTEENIQDSLDTINVYRVELKSSTPRVDVMRQCGRLFRWLNKSVGTTLQWIGAKADKFSDAAATTAGHGASALCLYELLNHLNGDVSKTIEQLRHIIEICEKLP